MWRDLCKVLKKETILFTGGENGGEESLSLESKKKGEGESGKDGREKGKEVREKFKLSSLERRQLESYERKPKNYKQISQLSQKLEKNLREAKETLELMWNLPDHKIIKNTLKKNKQIHRTSQHFRKAKCVKSVFSQLSKLAFLPFLSHFSSLLSFSSFKPNTSNCPNTLQTSFLMFASPFFLLSPLVKFFF